MQKVSTAAILLTLWLAAADPLTNAHWTPLRNVIISMVETIALPFRLARLSAQAPDTVLLMPVAGARVRQIADTWGAPRPRGRIHRGQDIFARRGTAVRSATAGYVINVGRNALGGNVVVIVGSGARRYYYAHLEAFAPEMRVGKAVTPDMVIGFVGTSGNAVHTPPHLHFAIYTSAGVVNPLPLLRDRASSSP
jgi:murein DD-endopeptidase MepM/ murein hydrolase activator NlpD